MKETGFLHSRNALSDTSTQSLILPARGHNPWTSNNLDFVLVSESNAF